MLLPGGVARHKITVGVIQKRFMRRVIPVSKLQTLQKQEHICQGRGGNDAWPFIFLCRLLVTRSTLFCSVPPHPVRTLRVLVFFFCSPLRHHPLRLLR